MIRSYTRLLSQNKEKYKVPKKVQDTIPIDVVYDDGIFQIGKNFTKTFKFTDINFMISSEEVQESIALKYSDILNSFDSSVMAKITINNRKIDKAVFEKESLFKHQDSHTDKFVDEYNKLLVSKVKESDEIIQEKYITITVTKNNVLEARALFKRIAGELRSRFASLGSKLVELSANERMKILHDFYRNGHEDEFSFDLKDVMKKGHSFKDKIIPRNVKYKNDYFQFDNKFGRVVYVSDLPNWLDTKFVSELCEVNKNLMYSIDIISIPRDEAIKEVQNKLLGVTTNITKWQQSQNRNNNWSAIIPPEMETQREQCAEFLKDLTSKDQRMKFCTFTLVHLADSKEELDHDTETIKTIARENRCEIETLFFSYRQLQGIKQVLPIGINNLDIVRTLITESLATFMPFRAQEIREKGGIWYGQNSITHNPILINKENLQNPNTWVLGIPGSGKSFLTKEILEFTAASTDDDIIILDPEAEYDIIVKALKGQIIEIGANSNHHINAMDMTEGYGENGNSIADKSQFIMSLFEQLESDKYHHISSSDRSIIDRCVKQVYNDCFEHGTVPTLVDLHKKLESQSEREAKTLATMIELYTDGSLNIFAQPTNVDVKNRIVSFNINKLGKQLKPVGLLVVTDAIINRVNENWKNGRRTHVFIDEVHVIFENEESATFFASAWRQFRKRDAYPTGITQNVKYLLTSQQGTSMLSNSPFIIMLNQSPNDREELAELLQIPEEQQKYITDVGVGEGLIKYGNAMVPFINELPDGWLKDLNSTKPSDRLERMDRLQKVLNETKN